MQEPLRLRLLIVLLGVACLQSPTAHGQAFSYQYIHHDLAAVDYADAAWGDADLDGDFDLVVSGLTMGETPVPTTLAYINMGAVGSLDADGDSVWTQSYTPISQGLAAVWMSAASWLDVDGDGSLELVLAGARALERPFNPTTEIYRFSGSGFEALPSDIPGVYGASIDWGDFDNDGDPDLLITGETDDGPLTALFENDGTGQFRQVEHDLPDVSIGDAAFGDFDGDGDPDILLSGDTGQGFLTGVFRNDDGHFVKLPVAFPARAFSGVDWGDYDNDGDLDILVAGGTLSPFILDGHADVFRNDGGGVFTNIEAALDGMFYGAAAWGDYDNDGLLDILLSGGWNVEEPSLGRLYHNEGDVFRLSINLAGILFSEAALGDYDGDGDIDVLQVGDGVTNQYRNDQLRVNDPPLSPAGLDATAGTGSATMTWIAALDEQTPTSGLSYNVRVGTSPGGMDVVAPMANPVTGRRLLHRAGNVGQNTSWTITGLAEGTYYWSVQAVDNAYNGSPFADEASFSVTSAGNVTTGREQDAYLDEFRLTSSYPNPFALETTVEFSNPSHDEIEVSVFNALGERVRTLSTGWTEAGTHRIVWNGRVADGSPAVAGFYVVRISDGVRHKTVKLVKVR